MKNVLLILTVVFFLVAAATFPCFGATTQQDGDITDRTLVEFAEKHNFNIQHLLGINVLQSRKASQADMSVMFGRPTSPQFIGTANSLTWQVDGSNTITMSFQYQGEQVPPPERLWGNVLVHTGFDRDLYAVAWKWDQLDAAAKRYVEFLRAKAIEQADAEYEKWQVLAKERTEKYLAEAETVREWKTVAGRTVKGKLAGIDKSSVLIEVEDAAKDTKPVKIEAFRLSLRDRCIIEAYCNENKLAVPDIDPTGKIKQGMTLVHVEGILGTASDKNGLLAGRQMNALWDFGDNVTGFQLISIVFSSDGKVHKVAHISSFEKGIRSPHFIPPPGVSPEFNPWSY